MNGFELYNEIKKIDSQLKACFITAASEMYYDAFRNKKEKQYRCEECGMSFNSQCELQEYDNEHHIATPRAT